MRFRTSVTIALSLALALLALPAAASGQASRTWVSGVGDDANPCSRTAPCKTLAGAISRTAENGQINGMDPGGFGSVTITKGISIDLTGAGEGGVLSGGTGIVVNADPEDRVRLRGMTLDGLNSNASGIRILRARSVKIADVRIANYGRHGIHVENSNPVTRVVVKDSAIHDNVGTGVMVTPGAVRAARVTLRRNDIDDNGCGVAASRFGSSLDFATRCGTGGAGDGAIAIVNAFGNSISDSARQGFVANGSSATVRMARNEVTGSATAPALGAFNSGELLTFGNNFVTGNPGGNGATTGSAEPQM